MHLRPARLVSNVLFALGAVLAWLALPPRSRMITALGLAGPAASEARICRPIAQRSRIGRIPTGEVFCRGKPDPQRPGFRESVFYDAPSRRVLSAHVAFWHLDSVTAYSLADSIARTIGDRGGRLISCAPPSHPEVDLRRDQLWRFPGFDVILLTYSPIRTQPEAKSDEWHLALHAVPTTAADCRVVHRLHD